MPETIERLRGGRIKVDGVTYVPLDHLQASTANVIEQGHTINVMQRTIDAQGAELKREYAIAEQARAETANARAAQERAERALAEIQRRVLDRAALV